jgi:hypothetical protein
MKLFFRLGKAALASFFLLFIIQIFSSCNCSKHASKGKMQTLYGCVATEYQEKNVNHK